MKALSMPRFGQVTVTHFYQASRQKPSNPIQLLVKLSDKDAIKLSQPGGKPITIEQLVFTSTNNGIKVDASKSGLPYYLNVTPDQYRPVLKKIIEGKYVLGRSNKDYEDVYESAKRFCIKGKDALLTNIWKIASCLLELDETGTLVHNTLPPPVDLQTN